MNLSGAFRQTNPQYGFADLQGKETRQLYNDETNVFISTAQSATTMAWWKNREFFMKILSIMRMIRGFLPYAGVWGLKYLQFKSKIFEWVPKHPQAYPPEWRKLPIFTWYRTLKFENTIQSRASPTSGLRASKPAMKDDLSMSTMIIDWFSTR